MQKLMEIPMEILTKHGLAYEEKKRPSNVSTAGQLMSKPFQRPVNFPEGIHFQENHSPLPSGLEVMATPDNDLDLQLEQL
jgi:hypothetical protein